MYTQKMDAVSTSQVVCSDPEVHGGDPCFAGTRVPVDLLFGYLESGDTIESFLDNHPTVSRHQVDILLGELRALASRSARRQSA